MIRSDGSFVRDYLYVDDAAAAYLPLAEALERDGVAGGVQLQRRVTADRARALDAIRERMGKDDIEPVILDAAVGEIHDQVLSAAEGARRARLDAEARPPTPVSTRRSPGTGRTLPDGEESR